MIDWDINQHDLTSLKTFMIEKAQKEKADMIDDGKELVLVMDNLFFIDDL